MTRDSGEGVIECCDLPVTRDGLEFAVVSAERDVEPDDSLASPDEVEVLLIDASFRSGLVVEELDLLQETGLLVFVQSGTCRGDCGGEAAGGYHTRSERS